MNAISAAQKVYEFGEFRLYVALSQLHYMDADVRPLEDLQCRLLRHFVESPWKPFTHMELAKSVWGKEHLAPVTIREAITRVRQALDPDGHTLLKNLRGKGYYLAAEVVLVDSDATSSPDACAERQDLLRRLLGRLVASAIREMAGKGWAAPSIEWIVNKMREYDLGHERIEVLLYLWLFYLTRANFETAQNYAKRCLQFASETDDRHVEVAALAGLAITLTHLGRLEEASRYVEDATQLLSETQRRFYEERFIVEPGSSIFCQAALVGLLRGYPQTALSNLIKARQRAEKFNHAQTKCLALVYSAWVHQLRREPEATQVYADAAIALSDKHRLRQLQPWGRIMNGWAKSEMNRADEGIEEMREGLKQAEEIRSKISRTYFLVILADALRLDAEAALRTLSEAEGEAAANNERFFESEIHRLRGILVTDCEQPGKAIDCYRRAIDIAHGQGARLLELRARVALTGLLADCPGRLATELGESQRDLQKIYDTFSEGHDTRDLIEAKTLLDRLSSNPTALIPFFEST